MDNARVRDSSPSGECRTTSTQDRLITSERTREPRLGPSSDLAVEQLVGLGRDARFCLNTCKRGDFKLSTLFGKILLDPATKLRTITAPSLARFGILRNNLQGGRTEDSLHRHSLGKKKLVKQNERLWRLRATSRARRSSPRSLPGTAQFTL
jgi:hypothetical protein